MIARVALARWGMHAVLLLCALLVLFPVLWIGIAAFKTQIDLLTGKTWFTPTWANFNELLFSRSSDYLANFLNSLLVATVSTVAVALMATLAAYSLNRLRWPAWVPTLVLLWSVVFHMLPPITMVGPWYFMFRSLGLNATYTCLILTNIALNLPVGIWLMSVFVRDLPIELEEAARVDGCTTPQMLIRIVFPLVLPGLAAMSILVFVFSWNEFAVALNLTDRRTATVPVAIAKFAQEYEIKHGVMAAGALLSAIPAVIVLLFAQRHIVKGLTAGAVK
ncbi:MAG: carbohydrate ABC transporter permease [Burkholderiales bacterium]|nr:carbohydrate ABC transporter permease [Burkholderiales bacterium]